MSLVGQLSDLSLDDILKIIHLSRKSGHLTVRGRGQEWTIVFRRGDVVRLSSAEMVPTLAEELRRKAVLPPQSLAQAVEILAGETGDCLERVFVDRFGVNPDVLQTLFRDVAEGILRELKSWSEGAFCFDLWEGEEEIPSAREHVHLCLDRGVRFETRQDSPESEGKGDDGTAGFTGSENSAVAADPVWIVDDDPCLRQELGTYLRRRGMAVEMFETAADFWITLKKARVDGIRPVAVVDLVMPHFSGEGMLGGLELLEKVCSVFPDMRVLPLSDHQCPEAEKKIWALGVSEIFSKPRFLDMDEGRSRQAADRLGQVLFSALNVVDAPSGMASDRPQESGPEAGKDMAAIQNSEPCQSSPGLHLLRGMLEELNNPGLGGGIILLVLRFASEVMNRAVIFSVKDDKIVGLGQFGVTLKEEQTDAAIRKIVIPRDGDSILGRMLKNPRPLRTRFEGSLWDDFLCRVLGGEIPEDVFLGPIFSEGRVVAILYGDNLPDHSPVGNTEALEIFLSQAGLAMEKALLEGRLHGSGC
jgi:CheY-like chemotaxis protein